MPRRGLRPRPSRPDTGGVAVKAGHRGQGGSGGGRMGRGDCGKVEKPGCLCPCGNTTKAAVQQQEGVIRTKPVRLNLDLNGTAAFITPQPALEDKNRQQEEGHRSTQ